MKRVVAMLFIAIVCMVTAQSQTVSYTAFIYTSDNLAKEIPDYAKHTTVKSDRGALGSSLLKASLDAARGIGGGYVTSVLDLGVQAVAGLITKQQRQQLEWEQMVTAENSFTTQIHTISGLKDFYSTVSFASPLDPTGMKFDGIGVIRKEGDDTLFYISMHIDRSRIRDIVEHTQFGLVLDTLIFSPTHSNLPNSKFDTVFRWEERQDFTLDLHLTVTSSWMNELSQVFRNEQLGEFSVCIPVKRESLDSNGYMRYVRNAGEAPKYRVVGSSFVVPRSYSGYLDNNGLPNPVWGTGEYQIALDIKETCSPTDDYRKNWKQNYEQRAKKMSENETLLSSGWRLVTSQNWDEIAKTWVITVLKAPAEAMSTEIIDKLHLKSPKEEKPKQGDATSNSQPQPKK